MWIRRRCPVVLEVLFCVFGRYFPVNRNVGLVFWRRCSMVLDALSCGFGGIALWNWRLVL